MWAKQSKGCDAKLEGLRFQDSQLQKEYKMKKAIILTIAAVLVVTSLVSGVFAAYKTQIDNVSNGIVTAKDFVLVSDDVQNFEANAKIAPGESATAKFTLSNFESDRVTETAMSVTVTITRTSEIVPLTITLKDMDGKEIVLTDGNDNGSLTIEFEAGKKQTVEFTVTVAWPDTDNDIDYINKSASYTVSAVGVQK